ncbi:DUF2062 domain-containing protein [Luteolibacter pohnpeiensis]|uniref:DUF2062 domain-containing protein n=1 Tax=Luteolibacter pohnpeiensis TaxID=454153 RepID=A0A934S9T8_9BACT|nr:DUF2062 domain-containing protein [Luteolibacter pohnpeiensis]MBK1883516.1 DUF2062 domain-containing protein [Luteolibacter pohnpeiensis]
MSAEIEGNATSGPKLGFWRRWVVAPLKSQLRQGISAERLGWTIGAGVALGIFPVFGARAWLCLLAGWLFKLNQPVLHVFKGLCYPLHLLLLLPFLQIGQELFSQEPLHVSVAAIKASFSNGIGSFLQEFGWVLLHGAAAWAIIAPVILIAVRLISTPILRRLQTKWRQPRRGC